MTYTALVQLAESFFNQHKTRTIQSLKNNTKDKLIEKLKEINWFEVLNCEDVG